jgi:hypothetical protein
MDFSIDLNALANLANQDPFTIGWFIFTHGGWVIYLYIILWGFWQIWMKNIQDKYVESVKFTLLAIDIPKSNEQSVKAMEQFFVHLAGAQSNPNLAEKYIKGKFQLPFSVEIVSIDGYVQFLVRTPTDYRDMVESAIYAQYPDAELTEVNDYVDSVPDIWPNEEYDLWGTQLVLANKDPYPIKTYTEFEHALSSLEQQFIDPMAALLEALSRLREGEQVWLQFLVTPITDEWKEAGTKIAKKLIKAKDEAKKTLLDYMFDIPYKLITSATDEVFEMGLGGESEKKVEPPSIMQHLSPGERVVVEAVQKKIAKIGFKVKFRMVYVGKKDIFSRPRGVANIMGAIKQFNTLNLNAFKPSKKTTTKVNYFFVDQRTNARRNKICKAYKFRSPGRGVSPFILNVEELATVFHFPIITVKAPLLKKTESKKAEPPVSLPMGEQEIDEYIKENQAGVTEAEAKETPIPAKPLFDYDNPYFEQKFALNKKPSSASAFAKTTADKKATEGKEAGTKEVEPIKKNEPPPNLPIAE